MSVFVCMCVCARARTLAYYSSKMLGLPARFCYSGLPQSLGKVECAAGTDLWIWDIILPAVHSSCIDSSRVILTSLCSLVGAFVIWKTTYDESKVSFHIFPHPPEFCC